MVLHDGLCPFSARYNTLLYSINSILALSDHWIFWHIQSFTDFCHLQAAVTCLYFLHIIFWRFHYVSQMCKMLLWLQKTSIGLSDKSGCTSTQCRMKFTSTLSSTLNLTSKKYIVWAILTSACKGVNAVKKQRWLNTFSKCCMSNANTCTWSDWCVAFTLQINCFLL